MNTEEMNTEITTQKIPWLPILLILWNIFDVVVHAVVDMVEPWRVAGNVVGVVAALIVLFGVARGYVPQVLVGGAGVVVVLNAIHSVLDGWVAPSFVFIGVSLFLLLRWAQDIYRKGASTVDARETTVHLRWWVALGATVVGLAVIGLVGEQEDFVIGPLAALHNGELVEPTTGPTNR